MEKSYLFAARYPFSTRAKRIIEISKLAPNSQLIEKGLERIKSALRNESLKFSSVSDSDLLNEIGIYACARMILSNLNNSYLINKFSVSQAKRAYSYLNQDSDENIAELLDEFGFKLKSNRDEILIHFSTYLKYTPGSIEYRLIGRNIAKGYVSINKHELLRLLQEAIRIKISQVPKIKKISPEIEAAGKSLVIELPKITPEKLSFKKGDNPPCIEALLIDLKKHLNLNHQARWILAVYLIKKNTALEDILELFMNFPDYKEKIAKYQIEHAKKQGYMVPSCATIRGYGLCVSNCPVKNPMQWKKVLYEKYGKKVDLDE
ncbi:MAG: hypothetical protein WC501_04710 [Candidatus Micrarchaeia archaeon]